MSGADNSYAGVFEGRLAPGKHPALIVVDMVEAYLDPQSPLFCETAAAARDAAAQLLEAARKSGAPVIFTAVRYAKGGADGGLFYQKVPILRVFDEGSPLGEFPPQLSPLPDEPVVIKQYPSAFFATHLLSRLRERFVDTAVIAGYSTSGCVRATALDALQHGIAPFVVRDACADRHPAPHEGNLFDLQAKYAEVIGIREARAILAG